MISFRTLHPFHFDAIELMLVQITTVPPIALTVFFQYIQSYPLMPMTCYLRVFGDWHRALKRVFRYYFSHSLTPKPNSVIQLNNKPYLIACSYNIYSVDCAPAKVNKATIFSSFFFPWSLLTDLTLLGPFSILYLEFIMTWTRNGKRTPLNN